MKDETAIFIVKELSEHVTTKLVRSIRLELQSDTGLVDPSLDGVDHFDFRELRDIWDKICVQVRCVESPYWEWYESRIETEALRCINDLEAHEIQALWFRTEEFSYLDFDSVQEALAPDHKAIALYITRKVLTEAGRWTNDRIRANLEHR